jgi:hypothetical protein
MPGVKLAESVFDATDLVNKYSAHEIRAALAVVGDRHGVEFALTRKGKKYMMVQGAASMLTFDTRRTGMDQIFHVHTQQVGEAVHPSGEDYQQTSFRTPDQTAGVVGPDGWLASYALRGRAPWLSPSKPLWAHP